MAAKFDSRSDAARRLAAALSAYSGRNPLVLAIPRGAVEIGAGVAERLDGELDVALVRKLRAPSNPELALGAVDETGWTWIAEHAAEAGGTPEYLEREIRAQTELLRRRRALYTPSRPRIDPFGRIVIVVDDGIATGASMIAALHAAREQRPARLVCAVPVAAPEALGRIEHYADEVICLETPLGFDAVGRFYRHFRQVDDREVIRLLAQHQSVNAAG